MLSEAQLQGFRAGDSRCFAALYERYAPDLRTHIRAFVSGDDVDDLLQETWVRILGARTTLANLASFGAWSRLVCRSTCIDWLRQQRRARAVVVHTEAAKRQPDIDRGATAAIRAGLRSQEFCDWIEDQIIALPRCQFRIAALRWLLGHSTKQVAHELAIAPGTVKAALYHARQTVRAKLEEYRRRNGCAFDD
jgi:RNA polymerase sigma factor (sigma-70 family)